ncbi:hypothetical protein [Actinophytocola sp.]|uniref:hypothetical protein n=1 Tax=Actinophytocola sp. TaxID=1872138 RepID=UPI003D6AEDD1
MAGFEHGSTKTVASLTDITGGISHPVRQRTITYEAVDRAQALARLVDTWSVCAGLRRRDPSSSRFWHT